MPAPDDASTPSRAPAPSPSTESLRGRRVVIATMHGKEAAIAPVFEAKLGVEMITSDDLDTDAFGTFTGEIERRGAAVETAIRKARKGMAQTGAEAGVASEGSYGAHPVYHVIPGGSEIMTYVDDRLGIEVSESLIPERTNFNHCTVSMEDDLEDFLRRTGFPDHALIVRPNATQDERELTIFKGLRSPAELRTAISESASRSPDGRALVETDMRAHLNPTRMAAIATLAEKLAARLSCACPRCAAPGFGQTGHVPGLPCGDCGGESTLVKHLIFGCARCDYSRTEARPDGLTLSSPAYCLYCNP